MEFLRRLRELNPRKKVTIVMDNLTVHKAPLARELMRELEFEYIWVVPYSPEYNAIELPFGQIKKHFKEAKLRCLTNEIPFD